MTTEEWRPHLRHQFTVAELRDALNKLIEAEAGIGDQPILMEGPDGFEHWSGTFHHVAQFDGRRYVVAENYDDIWEREPPVERPRCGACGLPHDLDPGGWPAEICRRVGENGSAVR